MPEWEHKVHAIRTELAPLMDMQLRMGLVDSKSTLDMLLSLSVLIQSYQNELQNTIEYALADIDAPR